MAAPIKWRRWKGNSFSSEFNGLTNTASPQCTHRCASRGHVLFGQTADIHATRCGFQLKKMQSPLPGGLEASGPLSARWGPKLTCRLMPSDLARFANRNCALLGWGRVLYVHSRAMERAEEGSASPKQRSSRSMRGPPAPPMTTLPPVPRREFCFSAFLLAC